MNDLLKKISKVVFIFISILLFTACEKENHSKKREVIKRESFGMHIHSSSKNNYFRDLGYGSIRLWDTHTNWRLLEPKKGEYNFKELDQFVALADNRNQEILMTLGQPPNWATGGQSATSYGKNYNSLPPTNIDDWRDYIETIGTRYKGKIKYYEIWNEPNIKDFYSGSIAELITLTKEARDVLKKIDPQIKIISPSTTSPQFLDSYLKEGGKEYIDIVGVHLYVAKPEDMIASINRYKDVLTNNEVSKLPIWNTEFTWTNFKSVGINNEMPPEELAASFLSRALLIDFAMGIKRDFFYGLGYKFSDIKLVDKNNQKYITTSGIAYKNITSWLIGSTIESFTIKNDIFKVSVLFNNNRRGIIVWTNNESGLKRLYTVPSNYGKKDFTYSSTGEIKKYSNGKIQLTNVPQLIYEEN